MQHMIAKYMSLPCRERTEPGFKYAMEERSTNSSLAYADAIAKLPMFPHLSREFDDNYRHTEANVLVVLPENTAARERIAEALEFLELAKTQKRDDHYKLVDGIIAQDGDNKTVDSPNPIADPSVTQLLLDKEGVEAFVRQGIRNGVLENVGKSMGIDVNQGSWARSVDF